MSADHPVFDTATAAGRLMAATDWAATPVGDPASWPVSLTVLVRTILSSRYPMLVLWGEQYTQLYNDAYSALIGAQHPGAMGQDCRITLAEGWPVLGPLIDEAMATGVASWVPALQLLLDRSGYREEAYFSVSHAPATDDDGVTRGVLTVCSEVTEQVVGERRLRLLQRLSLGDPSSLSVQDVAGQLVDELRSDPLDVPFVGLYLRDGSVLRLLASSGVSMPDTVPVGEDDAWGLSAAAAGLAGTFDLGPEQPLTGGAFGDPVTAGFAMPIPSGDPWTPRGVLVAGVSPSRALDELYRSFLSLLAQQVGVALRNALAREEERARAEALAELDRAKTEFFTNVSHEFRTPLTLMLGPLADAVADEHAPLPPSQAERVGTALRASRRLLKLVNNLLTFSSVEAGSARLVARPVDLARLTTDLTAGFRAAVERGGLTLQVDCPPLPVEVAVDVDHWETVVTNLLSNALKFTFTGEISVRLAGEEDGVLLEVADTGVGIPADELPRLFERFHRVRGARARSHEGSGVGLSLVHELVALMGGEVEVESTVGAGTTFAVRVPWRALQPEERGESAPADEAGDDPAGSPAAGTVRSAVEEVEGWLAPPSSHRSMPAAGRPVPAATSDRDTARILVADDNADMRDHVVRLLTTQGWEVEAVSDGQTALEAVRRDPPDLLLTDVMMPGVDGFELLRAIRAEPRTATMPVVVLSARAGEGASVEGLELGADDYVVKPFDSRDLVARLRTTLRLARERSRHVAELDGLADATAIITSGQPLDRAVGTLARKVRQLTEARQVAVRLVPGDDREPLVVEAVEDQSAESTEIRSFDVLTVPVLGRDDREVGAVEVWLHPSSALRPQTRALLTPVARVLGALVEEGRHAAREGVVAAALQSALLPEQLPEVEGLELAAAYLPGEQDVQVGGDWYDVLQLPGGKVLVCIGDVEGRGLTSALVMGQIRTAVRAYALEGRGPVEIVRALEELVSRMPDSAFSTLFLGRLDVGTGELVWCSAGHPPPVLVRPGHPPAWLDDVPSLPLGASLGVQPVESTVALPHGATLVAYTDGLVEDRQHQLEVGMPALLETVAAAAGREAGTVLNAALKLSGPERRDDVAVLVLRRADVEDPSPLADGDAELVLPRAPQAAGQARREVRKVLRGAGVSEDATFELLVGLSEAINNAVEHALDPRRDEVVVRVRVEATRRRVRLEVQDFGRWRERRPSMDRGYGASLMSAGCSVQVQPGPDGTLVTLEREV